MPGFTQQHQTRGAVFFGAVRVLMLGLLWTALLVPRFLVTMSSKDKLALDFTVYVFSI